MRRCRTALIQLAFPDTGDALRQRIEARLREAAAGRADLAVLPELHQGRYFCQTEDPAAFDVAEPLPGPTTRWLGELAAELQLVIVASLFERRAAGLYHNTAVVIDRDGTLAGRYRKMHIPDDPGYYEKYYFTPGDTGFRPIRCSLGSLGVLVCWDQWFPEAARLMALAGAELLVYPTAIGRDPRDAAEEQARQREAWQLVQRGHAVANALPLVAVNRTGHEPDPEGRTPGIDFWGSSFATGPQGELLIELPQDDEDLALVDIDLDRSERVRRIWPFFRDRRIDAYEGLLARWREED